MLAAEGPRPAEKHRGYEISYVAGERSWYIKHDTDEPPSRESYPSAFRARRAIDQRLDAPAATNGRKKKR